MNTRKTTTKGVYLPYLPDEKEDEILNNDVPNRRMFEKKFNFSFLNVLRPSYRKYGATRVSGFSISKNQYLAMLQMGLSHRFKPHPFLLSEFNLKTSRFFSAKNRVTIQTPTFQARLMKPKKLEYFEREMKSTVIEGSDYFLKFKFKKCEEVIKEATSS